MGFADARAAADRAETIQRHQAARTVLDNSVDANDCAELLSMLGLAAPQEDDAPVRTGDERARDQRADDHAYQDTSYPARE
ncbi:hypothetical protein A6A25_13780 [Saccharothrix sp. CB00851]|nr:hypothetical protein A6A25_13780 [Saccharothrix sp. CB00851]